MAGARHVRPNIEKVADMRGNDAPVAIVIEAH